MRIERDNSIGLVIDIQERLVPVMNSKDFFLENTGRLIIGLQELNIPLLVTQQYTKGLGETVSEISTLINQLNPIEKSSFSCYDEPVFVKALENTGVKNVIICGIESHVCVLQTAIDLKTAGFNPVVVFDCISSRTKQNMKLAIERFRYEGIIVASCESILFELTRGASDPAFKAISKLLK
jgi:nicotinamidase-related amidase